MFKSLNTSNLGTQQMVKVLLGGAGLVVAVGGVSVFLMNSQIRDLQKTVNAREGQVGSNEQVANRYQQTLTDYNSILARTQYLEASVSATAFVPTLLRQLQDLAQTTHLTVVAVRPGPITTPTPPDAKPSGGSSGDASATSGTARKLPPPPYDTVDIGVDVTGTYAATATFLYDLTRFPKVVSVANVQMHPGGASDPKAASASPILTTNLHLTAFVFHDGAAAPPSPAVAPVAPLGGAHPAEAFRALPLPGAVSDAAAHAAGRAIGATQAVKARSEVGVQTL